METLIHLLQRLYLYQRYISFNQNPLYLKTLESRLKTLETRVEELRSLEVFQKNSPQGFSKTYSTLLQEFIKNHRETFQKGLEKFQAFQEEGKKYKVLSAQLISFLEKMEEEGDSKVEGEQTKIAKVISTAYRVIYLTLFLSLIIAALAGFGATRSITKPLNTAVEVSNQIGEGGNLKLAREMVREIDTGKADEMALLGSSLNNMITKLSLIFEQLDVSQELDHVNQKMLSISSQQVQGIEEVFQLGDPIQ